MRLYLHSLGTALMFVSIASLASPSWATCPWGNTGIEAARYLNIPLEEFKVALVNDPGSSETALKYKVKLQLVGQVNRTSFFAIVESIRSDEPEDNFEQSISSSISSGYNITGINTMISDNRECIFAYVSNEDVRQWRSLNDTNDQVHLIRTADNDWRNGNHAGAEFLLWPIIRFNSKAEDRFYDMAKYFLNRGNYKKVTKMLEPIKDKNPAKMIIAEAAYKRGLRTRRDKYFDQALELMIPAANDGCHNLASKIADIRMRIIRSMEVDDFFDSFTREYAGELVSRAFKWAFIVDHINRNGRAVRELNTELANKGVTWIRDPRILARARQEADNYRRDHLRGRNRRLNNWCQAAGEVDASSSRTGRGGSRSGSDW